MRDENRSLELEINCGVKVREEMERRQLYWLTKGERFNERGEKGGRETKWKAEIKKDERSQKTETRLEAGKEQEQILRFQALKF